MLAQDDPSLESSWPKITLMIDFHSFLAALKPQFWSPFWNPFRFMKPSRVSLEGKLITFGESSCESLFLNSFYVIFIESWAAKTMISHGRGIKNHNFTEVRILSHFNSISGVILRPKYLENRAWLPQGPPWVAIWTDFGGSENWHQKNTKKRSCGVKESTQEPACGSL